MEKLRIISSKQPIENAILYDTYSGAKLVAVHITANEGFELVKGEEEPNDVRSVDIPIMHRERVNLYKAIPWAVKEPEEEPEEEIPEVVEATEEDYINALKDLGVVFNA